MSQARLFFLSHLQLDRISCLQCSAGTTFSFL
uniref:Uncharacterized protein n=1 Tax=Anguilla anguilla TaxID=7936 RepID=A0A0E9Q304_ANGAN